MQDSTCKCQVILARKLVDCGLLGYFCESCTTHLYLFASLKFNSLYQITNKKLQSLYHKCDYFNLDPDKVCPIHKCDAGLYCVFNSASWACCRWAQEMTWRVCWAGEGFVMMMLSCCRFWRNWREQPPRCWTGK